MTPSSIRNKFLPGLALAVITAAADAQTAVGTAIQYQGRLQHNGASVNGTYDFRFRLWDADAAGTQIGTIQAADDLAVTDGLFTTAVDFGPAAFSADARWLEIGVRPGSSVGAFTVLAPRQRVYATPVALFALNDANWSVIGADIHNNNTGKVGIGESTPLVKLHVTGSVDLGPSFDAAKLSDEKFVIEGADSWLGIYSDTGDTLGSGITLGEFDTNSFALNKWSMYRRGSTGSNDLVFSYGADPNPNSNPKIMQLLPDGAVGIGKSPTAQLHVYAENDEFTNPLLLRLESLQTPNPFTYHYAMEFTGHEIDTYDEENNTGEPMYLNYNSNGDIFMAYGGGNVAVGSVYAMCQLHVEAGPLIGFEPTDINSEDVIIEDDNAWLGIYSDDAGGAGSGIALGEVDPAGGVDKWAIYRRTNSNVGDLVITHGTNPNPTANEVMFQILPDGTTKVQILEITGADVAERFPCSEAVEPGSVVMIDAANPGQLCLSKGAYNTKVAGVISGAGDIPVGAILGNLPGKENAPAVALSGRVWVRCDATDNAGGNATGNSGGNATGNSGGNATGVGTGNAIEPGDLITTAERPGYAMKAADHARASGATIGKAMTALAKGESGLVLVLVNLQ